MSQKFDNFNFFPQFVTPASGAPGTITIAQSGIPVAGSPVSGLNFTNPATPITISGGVATVDLFGDGSTVSFGPIGATPNANAATISPGGVINLQPASQNFGGLVTTGAQTIAGVKQFSNQTNFSAGAQITAGQPLGWSNGSTLIGSSGGITANSDFTFNGSLYFGNNSSEIVFKSGADIREDVALNHVLFESANLWFFDTPVEINSDLTVTGSFDIAEITPIGTLLINGDTNVAGQLECVNLLVDNTATFAGGTNFDTGGNLNFIGGSNGITWNDPGDPMSISTNGNGFMTLAAANVIVLQAQEIVVPGGVSIEWEDGPTIGSNNGGQFFVSATDATITVTNSIGLGINGTGITIFNNGNGPQFECDDTFVFKSDDAGITLLDAASTTIALDGTGGATWTTAGGSNIQLNSNGDVNIYSTSSGSAQIHLQDSAGDSFTMDGNGDATLVAGQSIVSSFSGDLVQVGNGAVSISSSAGNVSITGNGGGVYISGNGVTAQFDASGDPGYVLNGPNGQQMQISGQTWFSIDPDNSGDISLTNSFLGFGAINLLSATSINLTSQDTNNITLNSQNGSVILATNANAGVQVNTDGTINIEAESTLTLWGNVSDTGVDVSIQNLGVTTGDVVLQSNHAVRLITATVTPSAITTFDFSGSSGQFKTSTGNNILNGTNLAFYAGTPHAQANAITAPTGGTTIDTQARTAINAILVAIGKTSGVGITKN